MGRGIAFGVALVVLVGCQAKANVQVEAKEPEAFSAAGQLPPPAPSSAPASTASVTSGAGPAAASVTGATPVTTLPDGCRLVCHLADAKGRLAPEAEAKFTAALADDAQTLRGCSWRASFTLRFDSAGSLTEYGVEGDENACVGSVRGHHPALSYPGPAIVRCIEHCRR